MADPTKDEDKKGGVQAGVLDVINHAIEPLSSLGDHFSNFGKAFEGVNKYMGALESRFSRLTDVMDDFYTRMDKLGMIGEGGRTSSDAPTRTGLLTSGMEEQRRLLSTMREKWGKPYGSTGRPYAETEASRESGYSVREIKNLRSLVESGRLGGLSEFKDMFSYMRAPKDIARAGMDVRNETWSRIEPLAKKPTSQPVSTTGAVSEYDIRDAVADGMKIGTKYLPEDFAKATKSGGGGGGAGGGGMGGGGGYIPPAGGGGTGGGSINANSGGYD